MTENMGNHLSFSGVGDNDVYNITAPFRMGNTTVIAGRVEKRTAWADSQTMFFQEENHKWKPIKDAPIFNLEDPFATKIRGELIFGGVSVTKEVVFIGPPVMFDPLTETRLTWNTVFYRGKDLKSLRQFAVGPKDMKDIRLTGLLNGNIGVFTRPQGGKNGRGQIGYIELPSLEDLTAENLLKARIIENQFTSEQWGSTNEFHLLNKLHPLRTSIGVLGHIARFDLQGAKHYAAMAFTYTPETHTATPIEIIARRRDFPMGNFKAPWLLDVVFPGGLIRNNGQATLYAGLSDAEAGSIDIPDPF
ncbi:MAG: DUF1861 family protein [Candidatus Daviesbacteria bacterium]|nr:DUF1861 family protein [Candidatus Daviesbacteria bacterium]